MHNAMVKEIAEAKKECPAFLFDNYARNTIAEYQIKFVIKMEYPEAKKHPRSKFVPHYQYFLYNILTDELLEVRLRSARGEAGIWKN